MSFVVEDQRLVGNGVCCGDFTDPLCAGPVGLGLLLNMMEETSVGAGDGYPLRESLSANATAVCPDLPLNLRSIDFS